MQPRRHARGDAGRGRAEQRAGMAGAREHLEVGHAAHREGTTRSGRDVVVALAGQDQRRAAHGFHRHAHARLVEDPSRFVTPTRERIEPRGVVGVGQRPACGGDRALAAPAHARRMRRAERAAQHAGRRQRIDQHEGIRAHGLGHRQGEKTSETRPDDHERCGGMRRALVGAGFEDLAAVIGERRRLEARGGRLEIRRGDREALGREDARPDVPLPAARTGTMHADDRSGRLGGGWNHARIVPGKDPDYGPARA